MRLSLEDEEPLAGADPESFGGGDVVLNWVECQLNTKTFRSENERKYVLSKCFMSGAYSEFFSGRGHQISLLFKRNFLKAELF